MLLAVEAASPDGFDPLDKIVGHGGFTFDAADAGSCAAVADPVEATGIPLRGREEFVRAGSVIITLVLARMSPSDSERVMAFP